MRRRKFLGVIIYGDALNQLKKLESKTVHCCVTSPPYWGLRDYGVKGQLGLENSPEKYVSNLVTVFSEVKRVLRDDGTLWLILGDSYTANGKARTKEQSVRKTTLRGGLATQMGILKQIPKVGGVLKPKDLVGIPWRVAFALQANGWWLRSEIIWHKSNCLPESVKDRPTKAHETIFLLSKSKNYYYDQDSIREPHSKDSLRRAKRKFNYKHKPPGQSEHTLFSNKFCHPKGKNKRTVWNVSTKPFKGAHFATFPPDLIKPCIMAGCPKGGTVLDPFFGSGTVGLVSGQMGRKFIGIELNLEYVEIAKERIGLFW